MFAFWRDSNKKPHLVNKRKLNCQRTQEKINSQHSSHHLNHMHMTHTFLWHTEISNLELEKNNQQPFEQWLPGSSTFLLDVLVSCRCGPGKSTLMLWYFPGHGRNYFRPSKEKQKMSSLTDLSLLPLPIFIDGKTDQTQSFHRTAKKELCQSSAPTKRPIGWEFENIWKEKKKWSRKHCLCSSILSWESLQATRVTIWSSVTLYTVRGEQ